jgi:pimeloyl-ACP methyl ester carboxylesterase
MLNVLDPNPSGTPAVVLLHGLGADATSWTLQLDPLSRAGFRPLAFDVPGFGASRYDGRGWSIKCVAGEVAAWVQSAGPAPVHVVGLSMGGVIAQQLVLDYPHLAQRLVLVSTFAVLRPANLSQWMYFVQRLVVVHLLGLEQQSKIVAARVFPGPEYAELRALAAEKIASADPRAYRAAMRALGLFDSRRRLGRIKVPVLVITGASDSTIAPARQRLLVDGIPGARQVVIPGGGHAVSLDRAEEFNSALLSFLKEG